MQHIKQWKEEKRVEFLKLCLIDIKNGGLLEPYEGVYEEKCFDWFLSQLPSLLTLVEEGVEPNVDVSEAVPHSQHKFAIIGENNAKNKFRTLLAEAKQHLT